MDEMNEETRRANREALKRICEFIWGAGERNEGRIQRLARTLENPVP